MIMIDVVMKNRNDSGMSLTGIVVCSFCCFFAGVIYANIVNDRYYRQRMLRYLAEIEYWSIRCTEMQQQLNEMERFKDGEDWKNG
jgi:hypothetical protein